MAVDSAGVGKKIGMSFTVVARRRVVRKVRQLPPAPVKNKKGKTSEDVIPFDDDFEDF